MLCKSNFTEYIYKVLHTKQLNCYLPILLFLIFSRNSSLFHPDVRSAENEYVHNHDTENE